MNIKNILIIGRGHLGTYLHQMIGCMRWHEDMSNLTTDVFREFQPSMVVNCAGKTDLKFCEENPLEAYRNNVELPLEVYRSLKASSSWNWSGRSVPYVHLSSGCLWNGPYNEDGRPFSPNDTVSPQCWYAKTKHICDTMLLGEATASNPVFILRPRLLYSHYNSPRNTLVKLLKYDKLLTIQNSISSVDVVQKTVRCLADPIYRYLSSRIINVYDSDTITPYEIGLMLHSYGLRDKPAKLEMTDLDSWHKPKRVNTVLKDDFFESLVQPKDVRAQLGESIELLKGNLDA